MSMESDIKSVTITGTGVAVNRRSRLRGIFFHNGGGAGSLVIKDDGGETILTLTPTSNSQNYLLLPGRGMVFRTNMNCTTFTNLTSVTLFYEG